MTADPSPILKVTRQFTSAAERIFDAWLDPEIARKWLFATEEGEMVRAEVDARIGGKFIFDDRRGGEDIEHVGEYLEIDRPAGWSSRLAPNFSQMTRNHRNGPNQWLRSH